jgi:hypothetical protein
MAEWKSVGKDTTPAGVKRGFYEVEESNVAEVTYHGTVTGQQMTEAMTDLVDTYVIANLQEARFDMYTIIESSRLVPGFAAALANGTWRRPIILVLKGTDYRGRVAAGIIPSALKQYVQVAFSIDEARNLIEEAMGL